MGFLRDDVVVGVRPVLDALITGVHGLGAKKIESKASIMVRSDNPDGPIRYIMSNIVHDWKSRLGNP